MGAGKSEARPVRYTIELTPAGDRQLDRLPAKARRAIGAGIDALAENPRPSGVVPLKGKLKGSYRLRVGSYRVGYQVDDKARVVTIWQVGHRSKFYNEAKRRRK